MTDNGTIVIIGAGLTGAKAAEALRAEGYEGRIVLFGEEPLPPYLRPPLSKEYLRGVADLAKLFVHPESWYAEHRIEHRPSSRVDRIEPATHEVVVDGGERVAFDRLLIATGSEPRRLEIPGGDFDGVHYLRTVADADAIRAAAKAARRVVVIGGGWIGSEVAASMRQLGLPVTLVIGGAVPLERVLGPEVGRVYRDLHLEQGVELVTGQPVVRLRGKRAVQAVETADGTRVEGDLVVVGI
ncbi:MAG TPA: FAD-dependent oxidoreductase, partial [Candidatus Limnocylindrales bacterium]